MRLDFEITQQIANGSQGTLTHMQSGQVVLFFVNGGMSYMKTTSTPLGEWENRVFEPTELACDDSGIMEMSSEYMAGALTWLTWQLPGMKRRVAIYPYVATMQNNIDFMNGFLLGYNCSNRI